jgi:hypothetical protein
MSRTTTTGRDRTAAAAAAPRRTPTELARGGSAPGVLLPLLTAAAAAATLVVMSVLFTDAAWVPPALAVVVAVVATGALLRATRLPLVVVPIAQTLAFLLVAVVLGPGTPAEGGASGPIAGLVQYRDTVVAGVGEIRTTVSPAASTAGLVAVVMLLVFLAALIVETLAVGLAQPGLAGLVLLVAALVPLGIRPVAPVLPLLLAPAVAWLAIVAADQAARLAAWRTVGPGTAGDGAGPARRAGPSGAAAAVPLGAAVVALATAAAILVAPSLAGSPWLRSWFTSMSTGGSASVDPVVDVASSLTRGASVDVLRYRSSDGRPHYLRLVTLEAFDGVQWRPYPVVPGTSVALVRPGRPIPQTAATVELAVATLGNAYLPLPDGTTRADVDPGQRQWGWDVQTGDAVSTTTNASGARIQAEVVDTAPAPEALRAAWSSARDAGAQNVFVPASVPASVGALATEVTRGATTNYDRALALQDWFTGSGGFRYSLQVPDADGRDPLEAFLQDRVGFCQQFATGMAVLARELGIPARLVVGFTGGRPDPDSAGFLVSGSDAHVWPELWFDGIGWVRFEPTPGGSASVTPPLYSPQTSRPSAQPAAPEVPTVSADPQAPTDAPQPQAPGGERGSAALPGWLGPLVGAVAVLAVAALPSWWRRRLRTRRLAAADAGDARQGWAEVVASAVDAGVRPAEPAETLRAVAERVADALGEEGAAHVALAGVVAGAEDAAYGPAAREGGVGVVVRRPGEDVRNVIAELDGLARPWWRRVLPRSVQRRG